MDGGDAAEARPGEEGRGHHGEDGGGQAVLRRAHQLHRERLDAGQGDPAGDLHERGGGVQHRGPQDVDQADQPARLLQADGGGAGHPAERARGEQGGRDVQGGGAEPEPVHLRGRGLRLRGGVPERQLLDHELPRRRRDLPDLRAERQEDQELLAVGERALLPRPPHHGRGRHLQAQDHHPALLQRGRLLPGEHGGEPRLGLHGREVVEGVPQLHLRGRQDQRGGARPSSRTTPTTSTTALRGAYSGYGSYNPLLYGNSTHGEPDHPELRLQHGRQPLDPARRHAPHRSASCWRAGRSGARSTTTARPRRRSSTCRSGARCRSGCAGSTPSSRRSATRGSCPGTSGTSSAARRRSAGYPIRSISPTNSQNTPLGGNKMALFNAEYYFDVFGPLRALLYFDAGRRTSRAQSIEPRRAPDVHRGRAALRHARPERAVPPHLRHQSQPVRVREAVRGLLAPSSSPSGPPSKENT